LHGGVHLKRHTFQQPLCKTDDISLRSLSVFASSSINEASVSTAKSFRVYASPTGVAARKASRREPLSPRQAASELWREKRSACCESRRRNQCVWGTDTSPEQITLKPVGRDRNYVAEPVCAPERGFKERALADYPVLLQNLSDLLDRVSSGMVTEPAAVWPRTRKSMI